LQANPQVLLVHTGTALGSDDPGHVTHEAAVPHCIVLSSGKHPLVDGHVCVPAPQFGPHIAFTHASPAAHGVQSMPSWVPQVAEALLLTQTPLHRWKPVLQSGTQVDVAPLQVTVPLVGATHAWQVVPHELMLLLVFDTQALPHGWKFVLQVIAHAPFVQTGLPLVGSVHAVQPFAVQPDATLLLATHVVGLVAGQPWYPCAHVAPQVLPLHAGVPLATAAHAVQPFAVQPDATLLLATQVPFVVPPHKW
jgi:hypothetical protein